MNTFMKVISVISVLFIANTAFANGWDLCLTHVAPGEPLKVEQYIGQEDVGYGEFCYRVEASFSTDVEGYFCISMGDSGDADFGLRGSSYNYGKDCYGTGYFDFSDRWSHKCSLIGDDVFEAEVRAVSMDHCDEED